ncbi:MAG: DUF928 domain-containing protein [Cyanobacteria bacterium P01_H01_bin.15]
MPERSRIGQLNIRSVLSDLAKVICCPAGRSSQLREGFEWRGLFCHWQERDTMINTIFRTFKSQLICNSGRPRRGHFQTAAIALMLSLGPLSALPTGASATEYQPPEGSPPPEQTIAAGSRTDTDDQARNCNPDELAIPLTLLAPQEHVGRSTAETPSVAWFLPANAPYFYRVSLHALTNGAPVQVARQEGLQTEFGLARVSFSAEELNLQPEHRYIWQVAIACDPNSPKFSSVTLAAVDFIELPATVADDLAENVDHVERADIYASNRVWYDALYEALLVWDESGKVDALTDLLSTLAELEGGSQQRHLEAILGQI